MVFNKSYSEKLPININNRSNFAATHGYLKLLQDCLEFGASNKQECLETAAQKGRYNCVAWLIESGGIDLQSAFEMAVSHKQYIIVKYLLNYEIESYHGIVVSMKKQDYLMVELILQNAIDLKALDFLKITKEIELVDNKKQTENLLIFLKKKIITSDNTGQ